MNKELRESWSGYESVRDEEEPLLSEESRNETGYYQYEPDNLPRESVRPKTLSNIFKSVSHAFKSYYSDVSNESFDENQLEQVSSSSIGDSNSPENYRCLIQEKSYYL